MLETAVNIILNSMSFYNPVKDVLGNYDVNYELECLGLVNIGIKSSQELNFVESDKFCCSDDKIVKFAQLSERSQYEYRIPLNPEYIKFEFMVEKPALSATLKFGEENNLL